MLYWGLWILDKEIEMIRKGTSNWPSVQDRPGPYAALAVGAMVQTSAFALAPHYSLWRAHSAGTWVLEDLAYSRGVAARHGARAAKYETMTYWNYASRTRAFASRGGWRFAATRIGTKLLGPVGVALLMYDAWKTGIWIGEKLFGEMES